MLESRSGPLACVISLLYILAASAFAARIWIRCRAKSWSVDDYTYTAAFILAIAHAALVLFYIVHGYGRHIEDIPRSELESIKLSRYAARYLYVLSFGLGRIACALFVSTVAPESPLVWPARTTAALSGIWSVASVICLALKGNIRKPWTDMEAESRFFRWLGIESTGILLELSLFILSTSLIWSLHMATSRRLYLAAIFGLRLSLVPILATRIIFLQPYHYGPSPPWFALTPLLLAETALAASIMTGCATAPRRVRAALVPESARHLSKPALGDRYYPLYGGEDQPRARVVKPWLRARVPKPDLTWQPYQGFADETEETAYPPRVHISSERVTASTERGEVAKKKMAERTELPAPPMTIHRTTEVNIEYT